MYESESSYQTGHSIIFEFIEAENGIEQNTGYFQNNVIYIYSIRLLKMITFTVIYQNLIQILMTFFKYKTT